MSKSVQKTTRKVAGKTARHKNIRYHNDAYLFNVAATKICPTCQRPFTNRKKWNSRGLWPAIIYCSKACQKSKPQLT